MFAGVSTILPVFLRAAGPAVVSDLLRAVGTVLSQECTLPLELLIVDDGSTPAVQSIPELQSILADPRVRVLRLVRNQGLVFALNAGLTQARYDLIARIDADDAWRPGKLRRQLELLAADPELTLVASSMRLVHPGDPSRDRDELRGGAWPQVLALCERIGCPFPHGSILARKEVFELLGGYPHSPVYTHCEDYALWGAWVRFFKVAIIEDVLFEYTVSSEQISTRFGEQQQRASGLVHRAFLELGNHRRIPKAVASIAGKWELPLLAVSRILCTAWRFYDEILTDAELYGAAKIIFPDRAVHLYDDAPNLLGDRYFYLHRGPFDESLSRHLRILHTPDGW